MHYQGLAYMLGHAEVECAQKGCEGSGQDELRQGHAYTGAGASTKRQRPPHLQGHLS